RHGARLHPDNQASGRGADLRSAVWHIQSSHWRTLAGGRCVQQRRQGAGALFHAEPDSAAQREYRPGSPFRTGLLSAARRGGAFPLCRSGDAAAHGPPTPGRCRISARPAGRHRTDRGDGICPVARTRRPEAIQRALRWRRRPKPGLDANEAKAARRAVFACSVGGCSRRNGAPCAGRSEGGGAAVTTRPPLPAMLNGLAELAELHDVFLVDQFGVLHDGRKPYPGAVEALSRLKKAGKTVVILSNSGKRARPNETRLAGLGFDPSSWDLFLSSGEAAWRRFAGLAGQPALKPGTRCLLIARDNDKSAVEGLGFELVDRDPDLVLISASEGNRVALEAYAELLA